MATKTRKREHPDVEAWREDGGLPRLRPKPHPVTPYGPFRLREDGKLERFRSRGQRVIDWIETHCVFTDGRWAGQPVELLPWQKQLILDMFEEVWDDELDRWRLRYRTCYIGVPKKQGKTELVAFIALWLLLDSGFPSPGIPVAAASDEQADLVFRAASFCALNSPTLKKRVQVWNREIVAPKIPNGRIRRVAASGGRLDGMKNIGAIYDEVHEWVTPNQRKVYGMLRGSLATAEEPLNIMITTAGVDDGTDDDEELPPWLRMYRYGLRVQSGEVVDDAFFFRWWQVEPGTDHRNLDAYMDPAVNPSAGVTVRRAFYADELNKRTESEMRRYYFNEPVEARNLWLDHGTWEACNGGRFSLDRTSETFLGWDASTKRDSTAVVLVQKGSDGRYWTKAKVWERPWRAGEPDPNWRVPRNDVIQFVRRCYHRYNIVAGGYDPAVIAWVAEDLEDEGLALNERPQTDSRMVPGTQLLYEGILDERIAHDGSPTLARHIKAARVKHTGRGQRLVKNATGAHIDAAIALVIALGEMQDYEEPKRGKLTVGVSE